MSDSLGFALALVFAEIVPAAIALYATYWALSIRRALTSHVYRNHALWLGIVCVYVALTGFLSYSSVPAVIEAEFVFYATLFVVIFAYIDSTVRVARRSDPLLRSILRWETLRLALWADVGALAVIMIAGINPYNASYQNNYAVDILWTALVTILFIIGGPALLIGARRSRDPTLRGSLKWLGVALLLTIASFVEGTAVISLGVSQFDQFYSYQALPGAIITMLIAYALYRSAHSLAPISRLPAVEPATTEGPRTAARF
jgi:hypothetical protein